MSRSTSTLRSSSYYYEYMTTNGTFVYGARSNGIIDRFNYDGTGMISVSIYEPGFGIVESPRGMVIIDDVLWIVSRHNSIDNVEDSTYLVPVSTADWADSATPTASDSVRMYGVINGHGLVSDSTGRYFYVVSETDNILGLYDKVGLSQTTTSLDKGGAIARKDDQHYYVCSFDDGHIQEFTLTDPMTIADVTTITLPISMTPWQIAYNGIDDRFFISDQFGFVYQFTPGYTGDSLTSLTDPITIIEGVSTLGMYGFSKTYPDENTYYDIFSSTISAVLFNNVGASVGGDPVIMTLSGKSYTVPDYLTEFNYLTIDYNGSVLRVDCKTRRLSVSDFPYIIAGFNPAVDTQMYPHTYLDTIYITVDNLVVCQVDMDTLNLEHKQQEHYIEILHSNTMSWGTATTKRASIKIPRFGCTIDLCSDLHLLERHMIHTNVRPLTGASMFGAVVDLPCYKFVAESCNEIDQSNLKDVHNIRINDHILNFKGEIPEELKYYLNNHKLVLSI